MFNEGCIKYQGQNQSKVKFKFCALCLKDFYLMRTEKWGEIINRVHSADLKAVLVLW